MIILSSVSGKLSYSIQNNCGHDTIKGRLWEQTGFHPITLYSNQTTIIRTIHCNKCSLIDKIEMLAILKAVQLPATSQIVKEIKYWAHSAWDKHFLDMACFRSPKVNKRKINLTGHSNHTDWHPELIKVTWQRQVGENRPLVYVSHSMRTGLDYWICQTSKML